MDNLQIVHSAALDENGDAIDGNSFYSKFMSRLRKDWDVVDEGPMSDLLGIDCDRRPDGSILLNQGKYIQKMLAKFAPNGPVHKRCAVPYSSNLPRLVIEALENSTADAPSHPELVRSYQRRVGSLMYAATGTRPDLAYRLRGAPEVPLPISTYAGADGGVGLCVLLPLRESGCGHSLCPE